jgi:hypothetical protein
MTQQSHDVALEPDEFRLGDDIGMPRPMKSIACWERQQSKMTLRSGDRIDGPASIASNQASPADQVFTIAGRRWRRPPAP